MVIMEAIKRLSHQLTRNQIYFYRTASGLEVDLIVDKGNGIEAYEIKLTKTLHKEMTHPLSLFIKDHPVTKASLLDSARTKSPAG